MCLDEHKQFLRSMHVPMRLSVAKGDEPIIVPLWFIYEEGRLWCACHRNSYLVQRLRKQSVDEDTGVPCAFDISTNKAPYKGLAGVGRVTLNSQYGTEKLSQLAERYLEDVNSEFGSWLLARSASEEALCIKPTRVRVWDFTSRMSS